MTRFGWSLLLAMVGCSGPVNDQFNVQTADGAVLPVMVRGALDDTLVLYEPGGPFGGGIEERLVDYQYFSETLEPYVAIAYYDRRGYGNANGQYRPEDISVANLMSDMDDVLAVLRERYDPARIVLMGHSFGGFATGNYLVTRPDAEVDAWISSAGAVVPGGDSVYVPYRYAFVCRVAAERRAEGDENALWSDIGGWCESKPDIDAEDLEDPEREQLWEYLGQIYDLVGDPPIRLGPLLGALFGSSYNVTDVLLTENELSLRIFKETREMELLSELGAITQPTLFVSGELDDIVPTEVAEDAATKMVDAQVVEISDAGHYPTWPDPQPFADEVLDFLR